VNIHVISVYEWKLIHLNDATNAMCQHVNSGECFGNLSISLPRTVRIRSVETTVTASALRFGDVAAY